MIRDLELDYPVGLLLNLVSVIASYTPSLKLVKHRILPAVGIAVFAYSQPRCHHNRTVLPGNHLRESNKHGGRPRPCLEFPSLTLATLQTLAPRVCLIGVYRSSTSPLDILSSKDHSSSLLSVRPREAGPNQQRKGGRVHAHKQGAIELAVHLSTSLPLTPTHISVPLFDTPLTARHAGCT